MRQLMNAKTTTTMATLTKNQMHSKEVGAGRRKAFRAQMSPANVQKLALRLANVRTWPSRLKVVVFIVAVVVGVVAESSSITKCLQRTNSDGSL